jgi:hypothetical protein
MQFPNPFVRTPAADPAIGACATCNAALGQNTAGVRLSSEVQGFMEHDCDNNGRYYLALHRDPLVRRLPPADLVARDQRRRAEALAAQPAPGA